MVFDGGSRGNPGQGYGSFALISSGLWGDSKERIHRLDFGGGMTNNQAEYDSLIAALELLIREVGGLGYDPRSVALEVWGDSMLVIRQVRREWKVKDGKLRPRCKRARELLSQFGRTNLQRQRREKSVALLGH